MPAATMARKSGSIEYSFTLPSVPNNRHSTSWVRNSSYRSETSSRNSRATTE